MAPTRTGTRASRKRAAKATADPLKVVKGPRKIGKRMDKEQQAWLEENPHKDYIIDLFVGQRLTHEETARRIQEDFAEELSDWPPLK